jgi:hypothetical protein
MGAKDNQVLVPPIVNSVNSNEPFVQRPKRSHKTNLHINAWKLIDSEFYIFIEYFFSFTLEACCDPIGRNTTFIIL